MRYCEDMKRVNEFINKSYPRETDKEALILDALKYYNPFYDELTVFSQHCKEYMRNGNRKTWKESYETDQFTEKN